MFQRQSSGSKSFVLLSLLAVLGASLGLCGYTTSSRATELLIVAPLSAAFELLPHFFPETMRPKLAELTQSHPGTSSNPDMNQSSREDVYVNQIDELVLRDLRLIYTSPQTLITYASFSPEHEAGIDGGFGLHVIKKLSIGNKTVFVNEQWPFRRGHLQLPNEIRIRTRAFQKHNLSRGQVGSEEDFLGLRVRVAWEQGDTPNLFYVKNFSPDGTKYQRRVNTVFYECTQCHSSKSNLADNFRKPSEPRNFESITQASMFVNPLQKDAPAILEHTPGYAQLMNYLDKSGYTAIRQEQFKNSLLNDVKNSMRLLSLERRLEARHDKKIQIYTGDDPEVPSYQATSEHDEIYRTSDGTYFQDVLENSRGPINGKGVFWHDSSQLIPPI